MVPDAEMQEKPEMLLEAVGHLVRAPRERETMAEKLQAEARPGAAQKLAEVVIGVGNDPHRKK